MSVDQNFDAGFMIGTKNINETQILFDFFHKHQYSIRGYYKHVKIIMNTAQRFLTLRMPIHRYNPIKFYIQNNFPPNTDIIFNKIPFKLDLNNPMKHKQLQAYNSDPAIIQLLHKFITNNELSENEPTIRQSVKHKKYQMKWNVPTNMNPNEIKQRWDAHKSGNTMNLHTLNRETWTSNMKNNAIIALTQMFKYRISKYITHNIDLRKYKKYLVNKTIHRHQSNTLFPNTNIPQILSKYPFMQLYAPSLEPSLTTKINCKNIKIAFHNINGSAKRKTHLTHPYMQQLLFQHKTDIMALIDTRIMTRPTWLIPGYRLIAFKKPHLKTEDSTRIGGILIYAKYNLRNKIEILQKTRAYDTIWMSLSIPNQEKHTYIAINYIRPLRNGINNERNKKFFNLLTDDINNFKNESHNMFVIGDFNARMGALTCDHSTNNHQIHMQNLLNKTGIKIANPIHATGFLTCIKNGGGSIVDYVMTDAMTDIENMTVDCNPIYNDHRPIVFSLRNALCTVEYSDTHYMLSGFQPDSDKITKHASIIKPRLAELKKFAKNALNYSSNSERQFISNILTVCTFYTLHLATIIAFGVTDYNTMSKWMDSSITSLELQVRQNNLNNSQDMNKGKKLIKEAQQNYINIKKNEITKNTLNFGNLKHCQKLKTYKNLNKRAQFNDDEPYLLYKNKYVNKNNALSQHYQKINGPINDPTHNPKINDINEFHKQMNNFTPNSLRFLADKPISENEPPPPLEENDIDMFDYSVNNPEQIPHYEPNYSDPNEQMMNEFEMFDSDNENTQKYFSVEQAISSANPNSAAGYDGLKIKHLQMNSTLINEMLQIMYNTWNITYVIPGFSRLGSIVSILKTPNGNTPNEYRPITLLPVLFKVYERLILWHMNIKHKFRDNLHILQGGNRSQRGVPEQLGTLHVLAEHAKKTNKPLYCASLDIRKAFDTVWRKGMMFKLFKNFKIPIEICKILKSIYTNTKSAIRDIPFITNIFPLANGVLQGSVLSPVLFAAFIDDMIHDMINMNIGAESPIPNEIIPCIFYCDDVIITANKLPHLLKLIKQCETHSNNWAYEFNAKKCKCIVFNDPSIMHNNLRRYTQQQKIKINDEYHNKTNNTNHLSAPMVIVNISSNKKTITALNIHRQIDTYNPTQIPEKYYNEFKDHCSAFNYKITDKPFHIMYDNIIYDSRWTPSILYHKCKINGNRIKRVSILRYLGAKLCSFDDSNIVSTVYTNKNFLKKLTDKVRLIKQIDFNHKYIALTDKIEILKVFYLVYTAIFAQILDCDKINLIEATKRHNELIKAQTNIVSYVPEQFSIYTGVPSPFERWVVLKIAFYWKLINKKQISYMHKWAHNEIIYNYTLYKQYRELTKKWIKDQQIIDDNGDPKTINPFNEAKSPKELRPYIVKNLHTDIVNKFNDLHPLKVIQHHRSDYKCMIIYEKHDLENYVNDRMIKQYRQLFYNFGLMQNHCNLCRSQLSVPLEYHLCVACPNLIVLKYNYWNQMRFPLSKTGSKINKFHNQLYMQRIIEALIDVRNHEKRLWTIISGANLYKPETNTFYYSYSNLSVSHAKNTFLKRLTSMIHRWIDIVYRIHINDLNINRQLTTYKIVPDNKIMHHTMNPTIHDYNAYKHRIKHNDILMATDSSFENNRAGIGIFIKDNDNVHAAAQPIGAQTNHFGELFSIYKTKWMMNYFNIDTNNRRIILFTDSLSNFLSLINTPKNVNKMKYKHLFRNTQQYIRDNHIIMWKVKSHTKPCQPYNDVADEMADIGRIHPNNTLQIIPDLNSVKFLKLKSYTLPTRSLWGSIPNYLAGMFKQSVSMESDLEPD